MRIFPCPRRGGVKSTLFTVISDELVVRACWAGETNWPLHDLGRKWTTFYLEVAAFVVFYEHHGDVQGPIPSVPTGNVYCMGGGGTLCVRVCLSVCLWVRGAPDGSLGGIGASYSP